MTPDTWTKLVALAASLWEALKRDFPTALLLYIQHLRQKVMLWRVQVLVERANADMLRDGHEAFENFMRTTFSAHI